MKRRGPPRPYPTAVSPKKRARTSALKVAGPAAPPPAASAPVVDLVNLTEDPIYLVDLTEDPIGIDPLKLTDFDEDFEEGPINLDEDLVEDLVEDLTDLDEDVAESVTDLDGNIEEGPTDLDENLAESLRDLGEDDLGEDPEEGSTGLDKNLAESLTDLDEDLEEGPTVLDEDLTTEILSIPSMPPTSLPRTGSETETFTGTTPPKPTQDETAERNGATSSSPGLPNGTHSIDLAGGLAHASTRASTHASTRASTQSPSSFCLTDYDFLMADPIQRWSRFKSEAKRRGIPVSLDIDDHLHLTHCPCIYCGFRGTIKLRIGLDRIDSERGYTQRNCVPACHLCNSMKGGMAPEDFFDHIRAILSHVDARSGPIAPPIPDFWLRPETEEEVMDV